MIHYVTGDATVPQAEGPVIIAHVCNDIGAWGSGFVMAVSGRWPEPEQEYHRWHETGASFALGRTQLVDVGNGITVANMIAQHGTTGLPAADGRPPIRYLALGDCLKTVGEEAIRQGASVHMPRIGCGLAGGKWEQVEPLIEWALASRGVRVLVYDLAPEVAVP